MVTGFPKKNASYQIDLTVMQQTNIATRNVREIRWRPVSKVAVDPVKEAADKADAFLRFIPSLHVQKDFKAIINGMRESPSSAACQESGCKALMSMAAIGSASRAKIAQAGGLEAIFSAMKLHRNESRVQEQAFRALRRMSSLAATISIALKQDTDGTGIDSILLAINSHRSDSAVQYEALAVIRILANNTSCRTTILNFRLAEPDQHTGAIALVLAAMQKHAGNCAVCAQACGALRFLVKKYKYNI